jgi:hypothetical protein
MSVARKACVAVPFLNGSKQLHSLTIQLVHHSIKSTVKRVPDSTKRGQGAASQKGVQDMKIFGRKAFLKIAALATAGLAVSGCTYDMGLGYASDGYYDGAYDCDPYGGYDSYYQCDYGHGFYNIGYGGGWYDNFWYPGYGLYLFDNYGGRYPMRDNHRRYWGEKRHNWYRENRGRHQDGGRYQGRLGSGYTGNATPGAIGWPERNGGRVRDGDDKRRGRGDGRRGRNDQWRGGEGNGASAVPVPNPEIVQGRGRGRERGEGYGRPPRGEGRSRPAWRGNEGANAVPVTQTQPHPGMREGARGERMRGSEGRGYRQPPPQAPVGAPQPVATGQRAIPALRQERRLPATRQSRRDRARGQEE